jgi:ABC-type multidrug transport system ATPase subunit
MIYTENKTKRFGNLTAVDSVTLHVDEGEVFGFLGPNGAGKTTTVRMLCCLISKRSGEARIAGYEVGNETDSLKIRKIIGLVPDNVGLYEELSAYAEKENITISDAIFRAGGHIQSVSVVGSTLEGAYLKLVREDKKQ